MKRLAVALLAAGERGESHHVLGLDSASTRGSSRGEVMRTWDRWRRGIFGATVAIFVVLLSGTPALSGIPGTVTAANADRLVTSEDTAVSLDPLENDSGPLLGDSVVVTTPPLDGATTVEAVTGRITYTPRAHFNGSDRFVYEACTASSDCRQAHVTVEVAMLGRYRILLGRFTEEAWHPVSMWPDGSDTRSWSPPLAADWTAISPGGTKIAVARGGSLEVQDIDSGIAEFSVTLPYPINRPTWSPDGGALAFSSWNQQYGPILYELRPPALPGQQAEAIPIVYDLPNGAQVPVAGDNPAWGTVGIAFDSFRPAESGEWMPGIYIVVPGSRPTLLINDPSAGHPAWSPVGVRLAYHGFVAATGCCVFTSYVAVSDLRSPPQPLVSVTTANPDDLSYPAWSPDGSKVAYEHVHNRDLGVVNADGSMARRVRTDPAWYNHPSWDPRPAAVPPVPWDRPGRLLFVQHRQATCNCGPPLGDIHRIAANASGDTDFLKAVPETMVKPGTQERPRWSPDGTKIAFSAEKNLPAGFSPVRAIFVMNADGTDLRQLTHVARSDGIADQPAWSPDGTHLVFRLDTVFTQPSGYPAIWSMRSDGTDLRQLTFMRSEDPAWSPDGSWIAFVSAGQLRLVRPDSVSTPVTPVGATTGRQPAWSPDGTKLAFITSGLTIASFADAPTPTISVSRIFPFGNSTPFWSPDGRAIGYHRDLFSEDDGTLLASTMWVMNLDGTRNTKISLGGAVFADWGAGLPAAPAPHVTSVSPASGPTSGGTSVTVTGTGFGGPGTTVSFGGVLASISTGSTTSLTATTPAHAAGTVDVKVTNPGGGSGILVNGFTYADAPLPEVTSVSPSSGPTSGGTSVTVTGTGFGGPGTTVSFGGVLASISTGSTTSLTATTPAHAAGTVDVKVTNPGGGSGILVNGFTYADAPLPEVTSVSPSSGPTSGGTSVTVTGDRLRGPGTTVSFGGVLASISTGSTTSLTATTPAHAAGMRWRRSALVRQPA